MTNAVYNAPKDNTPSDNNVKGYVMIKGNYAIED